MTTPATALLTGMTRTRAKKPNLLNVDRPTRHGGLAHRLIAVRRRARYAAGGYTKMIPHCALTGRHTTEQWPSSHSKPIRR